MKYKVTIDRPSLKEKAYYKAKGRKVRNSGDAEENTLLISRLIYNILLKEKEKCQN